MPSKVDPGKLKSGSGKVPSGASDEIVLVGGGMAGAGPNIGQGGYIPPGGNLGTAKTGFPPMSEVGAGDVLVDGGLAAVTTHLKDPADAHAASAISIDGHPDLLKSSHVEGALDELASGIPDEPPFIGQQHSHMSFSGIPDWGVLKLNDSSLLDRTLVTSSNAAASIFPYYYMAPSPALGTAEFSPIGQDPKSDPEFNSSQNPATIKGAGPGLAYAGAFTRDGSAGGDPQPVMRTARILPRSGTTRQEVTISGRVYPADRGVLALIHWPADGTVVSFLAQNLLDRCVAALLLGQGISSSTKVDANPCTPEKCDGDPGGIFAVGTDAKGNYDPFAFPGRASGQYDLDEIHAGVARVPPADNAAALASPFDDFDGDTVAGAHRDQNGTVAGPGQVRLGTDPLAGEAAVSYGIPVLGAGTAGYDPVPATQINGVASVGNSVLQTSNFFRYRLPYLADYSQATGLKYTPRGVDPTASRETARYFASNGAIGFTPNAFTQAGNYTNFSQDYWNWQIARYRHTFALPSTAGAGDRQECGSYWLIHFKRELDFEAFVRDGTMPWDATDGYELYGSSMVATAGDDIELDGNVVNEVTTASAMGPAPTFGYKSAPYHTLRSTVIQDPNGLAMPAFTNSVEWNTGSSAGVSEHVMWVSGVAYFTPRSPIDGVASWNLDALSVASNGPHGFWKAGYRTSDDKLSTGDTIAPALLSSPNPAFINLAPFGFDDAGADTPTVTVPTGAAGAAFTDGTGPKRQRAEIPYTHMGTNAGGVFAEANGPRDGDAVTISSGQMPLLGDPSNPSFSRDAKLRIYFRRPEGHNIALNSALPYAADDGHGLVVPYDDGARILLHTTKHDDVAQVGKYGNRLTGASISPAYANFFTSDKDFTERFLDESYRYTHVFPNDITSIAGYDADTVSALNGPGLGNWLDGPIEVPVRAGVTTTEFEHASWVQNDYHKAVLGSSAPVEGLQVAGLPDRNPPITDGAKYPFPSSGILMFPHEDYTAAAVRPKGGTDMTQAQPDYSAVTGTYSYVRAFDVAFSRDAAVREMAGETVFKLRIDGVKLEDFAYQAPGPGAVAADRVAILVKVPGLTTWMDIGRPDGAGPSKQDIALDGAGCQVQDLDTKDSVDAETGAVYAQVKVNVGPDISLFKSTGNVVAGTANEVPVLVKVMMNANSGSDYNFEKKYLGSGNFEANSKSGNPTGDVRGVIGIKVIA